MHPIREGRPSQLEVEVHQKESSILFLPAVKKRDETESAVLVIHTDYRL